MADFVIITGLSGAGRSEAAKHLEDLGWFVIDNLPPALMPKVAELAVVPGSAYTNVALVVGPGHDVLQYDANLIANAVRDLEQTAVVDHDNVDGASTVRVRTLFLHARTPVLVRRYEATRHRHPFDAGGSLADAIAAEASAIEPLRADADVVIDTSDLNVHQLRKRLVELFSISEAGNPMSTRLVSFGFKRGVPVDVDLVFDCRFLPNPHWVDELRPLTGLDEPVRDYVLQQPLAQQFLATLEPMLKVVMPAYSAEGKSYLSIAVGCTGGHHRAVAITEELGRVLGELGFPATITHRDIET